MAGEILSSEEQPKLPDPDLVVDFGEPAPGIAEPMPPEKRAWYAKRIVNAAKVSWGPNIGKGLDRQHKIEDC